ncbi:hypothetical protein J28TS4_47600 [Paenibacillus lautus]|uniref:hypothetical protein n=1 Tax=Paenibacillus lautus TaxID=1401 RepID=UPI001B0A6C51|nr:hypothetical protein [Paenibacillus lautus]GIP06353.1 hypothetical protein J28TS4_47600 [Paenibacillus lautus]
MIESFQCGLFEKLGITSVLYIDDEIGKITDGQLLNIKGVLNHLHESEELEKVFKDHEDQLASIKLMCESGDSLEFDEDGALHQKVQQVLVKQRPEFIKDIISPADQLSLYLQEYSKDLPFISAEKLNDSIDTSSHKLIIFDYDFNGEFTALDLIKTMKLNDNELYYIILLSSHEYFTYESRDYKMITSESKQDLFRRYTHDTNLHFKGVINYINKECLSQPDRLFLSLNNILKEFESASIMIGIMRSIKELMNVSVEEAIKKLLLTNTRTLKALIDDKLEREGISESIYLVDFSLSIIKNLINNNFSIIESVHNELQKVHGTADLIDYDTDKHMRELRRIQIFDESVNLRHAPVDYGDVFRIKIGEQWVRGLLVSQSCDMVIRKVDGMDLYVRKEKVATIILEVPQATNDGCVEMRIGDQDVIWDVRNIFSIPTQLLDLVTLNSEGNACFNNSEPFDRKFTWSNVYATYVRSLFQELSKYIEIVRNEEKSTYEYNGMHYKFSFNEEVLRFDIQRLGRLDYFETSSVLKHFADIKTRIPLMLDPSSREYSKLNGQLNGGSTKIEFYSQQDKDRLRHFIAVTTPIESILITEGFNNIPEKSLKKIENFFANYKYYIYSEQIGAKMIELNTNTLAELKKLGFYIELSKNNITINFIFSNTLKYFDKEYKIGDDVCVYPTNSDRPKILLKKEFVDKVPAHAADLYRKIGDTDYVNITHTDYFPKITYVSNQIIIVTQPQKSIRIS